jgi:hypothetical protein
LAVRDSTVYIATPDSGLVVVDCSDPANPIQIQRLLEYAVGVAVYDSLLFVIDDSLNVFSISDPRFPILMGMNDCRPSSSYIIDMDAADGFAYWGEQSMLGAINVRELPNPLDCETFDFGPQGEVVGVSAQGASIAVTNSESGLWILRNERLVSGVGNEGTPPPNLFEISQNFPNPFNTVTTIRFSVPRREHISLAVFNTLGQKISNLVNGELEKGIHEIVFDGSRFSSGVYFLRLSDSETSVKIRMMLLK